MAVQEISELPEAPTPADSPTEFANKAAAFVPSLATLVTELNQYSVDVVTEAEKVISTAKDELNITAKGLFNSIVVGDTDGINNEFIILNSSFYPYWMLFVDGVKVPNSETSINGSVVTLTNTPVSGAIIEALAPMSTDFIAPDGFKTIAFCSDKNGTIEMSCTSNGSTPQWKVGETLTESTTFSYPNDGEYIYIYLYIPDDSTNSVVSAEAQDIYLIDAQYEIDSVDQLKLRSNSNLTFIDSLENFHGITSLESAFFGSALESFPLIDTRNCTTFYRAWRDNNLTSFPLIDSSLCTEFYQAWLGNSLTSFPMIDSSSCISYQAAWQDNNLTSFPQLNSSTVASFRLAWAHNDLTSFPVLSIDSCATFFQAWNGNSSLTDWSANYFDSALSHADYSGAWTGCGLTETAVNNILISINASGATSVTIGLDGGTNAAPTGSGLDAKSDLESRGCTVNTN